MDEALLYMMNSDENVSSGRGGGFPLILRNVFLWKVGTLSQQIVEVHLLSLDIVFELSQ